MRRRYRVKVDAYRGIAEVQLVRRWAAPSEYLTISRINLASDDAEDKLAEARARATALAHQVNGLERDRL